MAIKYKATSKLDKTNGKTKEKYYATAVANSESANSLDLVKIMKTETSLGSQDLLTVLELLPMAIETALANGQNVNIKGLGYFSAAVTSTGADSAQEVTPDKVEFSRIAFRTDPSLSKRLKGVEFEQVNE